MEAMIFKAMTVSLLQVNQAAAAALPVNAPWRMRASPRGRCTISPRAMRAR
jgi:hypothetical protein